MIKQTIVATGLLLGASLAAADTAGSFAHSTGFKNCVTAAERDARYLRVESTYYLNEAGDNRIYYLNGSGQTANGSGQVRIACETSPSGRKVMAVTVDTGRYAPRFADAQSLASSN